MTRNPHVAEPLRSIVNTFSAGVPNPVPQWKRRASYSGADYTFIYSATRERIAVFHREEDAQAAVVAFNNHAALIAELQWLAKEAAEYADGAPDSNPAAKFLTIVEQRAKALIAKATEQQA